MPSRLSKRQQREQEEILSLKADIHTTEAPNDNDPDDHTTARSMAIASNSSRSGFAAVSLFLIRCVKQC
jgi:hypothetical protein